MVTMRFSKVMCAFAVSVLLMGGATVVYAGDACKNVKIQFKNQRNVRIKVYKVDYLNKANNKIQTEDVKDLECANGSTCTTGGDNLRDAEGEDLTNFRIWFHDQEKDGDWSKTDVYTQEKVPVTQKCSADMTYKGNPVWTINP